MPSRYTQKEPPKQLVFATHNLHKFKEVKNLLPLEIELKSLSDFQYYDEIEETETTLEGNALLKAKGVYNRLGLPCFSDDSGLFVSSLEGAPGVFSARYAGNGKSDEENTALLLKNLDGVEDRSAYFKTVIVLKTEQEYFSFSGEIHGRICTTPRGDQGFGYDPVFIPNGYDKTFAQMDLDTKNKMSHRALALEKLRDFIAKKSPYIF